VNSHAQESSIFQNYYLSPFIINPAFAGSEYYPRLEFSVKKQWMGIEHSPSTILLTGDYRIGTYTFYDPKGLVNKSGLQLKDRVGLGVSFFSDHNGPSSLTGGMMTYAYHIPVSEQSRLAFGLSFTGTHYAFNSSVLKPDTPDDSYLLSGNESFFRVNFSAGLLYYTNTYFAGFSGVKLFPDVTLVNDNLQEQPSFFLTGGYKFFAGNPNHLEQIVTIKRIANQKVSMDLMTKLYFLSYNWLAVSYSSTGKIHFLFGIHLIKMLYAGYDYEYSTGKIAPFTSGSHKVYLGINLGLTKIKGIPKPVK